MSNAVFPSLVGLTYPVEKTPLWNTKVQSAVSGKETRIGYWSYPIWQYNLAYDVLRSDDVNAELQTLLGFFNARQGAFDDWLFYDPDDHVATNQQFAVADGSKMSFQLARSWGGTLEPVRAVASITSVTANGILAGGWTLDATTGVLAWPWPPAAGSILRWSGTFYWRCRFMEDQVTAAKFMRDFWETRSVKFQSVK